MHMLTYRRLHRNNLRIQASGWYTPGLKILDILLALPILKEMYWKQFSEMVLLRPYKKASKHDGPLACRF